MDGSIDKNSARNRAAFERFEAFYDYAFPRVYRFAQRKTTSDVEAEALCRLVLMRALASLGSLGPNVGGTSPEPSDLAVWLYSVARRVSEEVEADPGLLASGAESGSFPAASPTSESTDVPDSGDSDPPLGA